MKSEWMLLPEDALKAFNALKQICMSTPILAFADCTKEFLLERAGGSAVPKAGRWAIPPSCLW